MMALYFGCQSLHAYAIFGWLPEIFGDAGFSASNAGLLLAVTTAVSIPVSFVLPGLAVRRPEPIADRVDLAGCYVVGYTGLLLWPNQGAIAWCLLIGLGTGAFPLILTLIGLRSATPDGTAALSSFTQSVGYLIAGIGPFMMGFALRRHPLVDRSAARPARSRGPAAVVGPASRQAAADRRSAQGRRAGITPTPARRGVKFCASRGQVLRADRYADTSGLQIIRPAVPRT